MTILDLIEKKKRREVLNENEWNFFVENFTNGNIPDYQASSLLMAVWINGCNEDEIYWLTKAMLNSGEILEPKATNKLSILIDKHSSGGVGDKVSLILSPILVALGYDVAKLSGRGLAFTGGTIDKLDSINVNSEYNPNNYQEQLNKSHMFLMMQGVQIVPADKKMYALRDVTGTVDSLPLIAASIMSKKLAIKTDYIFLDVKIGDGAFCKNIEQGRKLASIMLKISKRFNRKTIIHLTNMSSPLGKCVGNAIEIKETVDFLNNKFDSNNLKVLIYEFATDILLDTKVASNKNEAKFMIDNVLTKGSAYSTFIDYVKNQGGKYQEILENKFWNPKYSVEIKANNFGYIQYLSTSEVGLVAAMLGAGRFKKEDSIDFHAGIYLNKENNQPVVFGETVATLYSDKPISQEIIDRFIANYKISKVKSNEPKIVLDIIK